MLFFRVLVFLFALAVVSGPVLAGPFTDPLENIPVLRAEHVVSLRVIGFAKSFAGGEDPRTVEVELRTRAGVRLYAKGIHMQTFDASGLPVELSFRGTPAPVREFDSWYQEEREFFGPGTVFAVQSPMPFLRDGDLRIRFEACNNNKCLMPETYGFRIQSGSEGVAGAEFVGELKTKESTSPESILPESSQKPAVAKPNDQSPPMGQVLEKPSPPKDFQMGFGKNLESQISRQVLNGGVWVLPLLFLAGLLMNLTPCVYPMIPITLSVLGRFRKKEVKGGHWIPLVFVLGVALFYSAMGVAAGLSGNVFGAILQSTWVQGGIASLLFVLGLGMLGVIDFSKLQELGSKVPLSEKSPMAAAFVMGGVSGLVSAPCTGPVLATLLLLVSQTQDAVRGFVLLFVFALGFGSPYLVMGAALQKARRLPHLGFFEEIIKFVFAALIFALSFYYAKPLIAHFEWARFFFERPHASELAITVVAALVLLLAAMKVSSAQAELENARRHTWARFLRGFSIVPLSVLALWLTLWALKAFPVVEQAVRWEKSWDVARERVVRENKPLLVDVWADWCASCREMDVALWSRSDVADLVNEEFVALKLDFSEESEESKELVKVWNLGGLPAVGFFAKGADTRSAPTILHREKIDFEIFFSSANSILSR
jgi:thiol:disulfide interchange protein DsbD